MPLLGNIIKKGAQLGNKLERKHQTAAQKQKKALGKLLKKASNTKFGLHYDFNQILKSNDWVKVYQSTVPIFDYNKIYDEWWKQILDNQDDICWKGKVNYFALSSGSTGASSKYIPVTTDMQKAMKKGALKMFLCLSKYNVPSDLYTKDMLMIGSTSELENNGAYLVGDLSGINARKPPIWMRRTFRPGTEVTKLKSWEDRIDVIVKEAPNWDIGFLGGIPSWVHLTLERIIEHHKLDNIHQLWPNLQVFINGGVAFQPYKKSFDKILAKPIIVMDTYLASEGFIAFQNRPETNAMALQLNNGIFFEFIPFDANNFEEDGELKDEAIVLSIEEVEEDKNYAILISTCSGSWRYLIGDVVKFTDKSRSEIIITGRTKHFLSICGEHLSVDNMNQAIQEVAKKFDIVIKEFTVSGVEVDNSFAHKWYIGCDTNISTDRISAELDLQLMRCNDDYKTERSAMLKDIQLNIIPSELFYKWQKSIGKMNGQHKIPRVMNATQFTNWEQFLNKENN